MFTLPRIRIGAGLAALALLAFPAANPAFAQTPAEVKPNAPGITIGATNPVVLVPVTIARSDTDAVLGFSVRIHLSSEFSALTLTGLTPDIALGNFLTDGGRATNLQLVSNGGGDYTVDGVTLGPDCGPTETSGTLFTIAVRSTDASGTGTVTVDSVTMRDCSNQPIAVVVGSPAFAGVDIDNLAPAVAVTQPNATLTWSYQSTRNITWSATDAAGVLGIDLEFSTDGGSNWTSVATGEANDGAFAWAIPNTPTANALVRVTATDANGNSASDSSDAAFTIVSNTAPVLGAIGDRSASEGVELAFSASATDDEAPPQSLTFTLVSGPGSITSGGAFSWTPGESDGGTSPSVTVRVTDDGTPPLFDEETFAVTVSETNDAPILSGVPASATIPELTLYSFDADATDADVPSQTLTFSLVSAPPGASIVGSTGVFSWTPSEAQGPGSYPFTVRVTDGVTNTDEPITLTVSDVSLSAITNLAAARVSAGNDLDGTTKVQLTWSGVAPTDSTVLYRAPYGAYPEYDDSTGTVPVVPAFPPSAPWQRVAAALGNAGQLDEVATRDFWYYVAFVHGVGENYSGVSNRTSGTLNYQLGDVSDGATAGQGDNKVLTGDISALGAGYGLSGAAIEPFHYLDVGPTTDFTVNGRPLTDNAIGFEDLVIFALNFGVGAQPQQVAEGWAPVAATIPAAADQLTVESPQRVVAGQEFSVQLRLAGTGRIQALSAALGWNTRVVEPIGVDAGDWLAQLNGAVFSPRPGVADLALLGARRTGFAGEGLVATIKFRALAAGEPHIGVASLVARDASNQEVELATAVSGGPAVRPSVTMLAPAFPNPAQGSAMIAFSLAERGPVTLEVFGVNGRRVRTLAAGAWEPGLYRLEWNGRDDAGNRSASGIYFVQLTTPQGRFSKRITYQR